MSSFEPIALQYRQFDPLSSISKAVQLKQAQQEAQLSQMRLAELTRQLGDQSAMRSAAASSVYGPQSTSVVNPEQTIGGMMGENAGQQALTLPQRTYGANLQAGSDPSRYLAALSQSAPHLVPGVQAELAAQDAAKQKASLDQQKELLMIKETIGKMNEQQRKEFADAVDVIGRGAGTVMQAPPEQRPQVYAQIHQSLLNHPSPLVREQVQQAPSQYSPDMEPQLASWFNQGRTITEMAKPPETPKADDKARAIYAKDKSKWTTDEQAFIKGYEKQVDVTKTQPGVARMEVLMNGRTVQVVDPNNPDNITYDTAGHARQAGAQAPGSVGFQVNRKTQEQFTSGPIGQQLMAINTAREHVKSVLTPLADALDNGNLQSANKFGNAIGVQFGSDKATNYRIAAAAVGSEAAKAFDGAGFTQSEREEAKARISDMMSKGQIAGAVKTIDALLEGKQKVAKKTYELNKQAKPNFGDQTQQSSGGFDWNAHPVVK